MMKRSRPHLKIWKKTKKSDVVDQKIKDLITRRSQFIELDDSEFKEFSEYPLSEATLKGLKAASFIKPTVVQRKSLKHTLAGKDVIVQAKTGSGKTLAFIIPILEYIFTQKITSFDGPVAVVLTPTRELAKQIFTVFYQIGKFHTFTMLDIMGGKTRTDKREEWQRAAKANILIGTPGRFAQHQQENPTLDMSNLHFLVLDEVDRLLDPTFRKELLNIAENLTSDRQCLLFSATLTKTQASITALGLKSPVMISTESLNSVGATPAHLIQSYSVVPLEKKLDYLWTFLQSHCKKKIIVFFSTQKQVMFVHNLFLQLRPYYALMQLRGNMLQSKRFKIYEKFSQTPRGAVLFATNVAERGLDFPEVDWVVQFDCPKQLDDYIHRVGRTARAERVGRAITFLLPSEVKLVEMLARRNVILRKQQFPESQVRTAVTAGAPALLASQPELATCARAAFTAYLRDYCFIPKSATATTTNSDKSALADPVGMSAVFQPSRLPVDAFAASLGLALTPELPKVLLQHLPYHAVTESKAHSKTALRLAGEKKPKTGASAASASDSESDAEEEEGDGVTKTESPAKAAEDLKRLLNADNGDEDSDDGELLKRKAFSVLRPELQAKVEATGKKLLEVVSSDDDDEEEDSDDGGEGKAEESKQVEGGGSSSLDPVLPVKNAFRKKSDLTRIQLAKKKLKRNIRTHTKIEFGEDGKPLVKSVGGVPVAVGAAAIEAVEALPPTRLDIEAERERLRTVVDAEDKARWRERVREKHRAERLKAREARKAANLAAAAGLSLPEEEVESENESVEDASGSEGDEDDAEGLGDVECVEESASEGEGEENKTRAKKRPRTD